jgi:hypothetical protein
VTTLTGASCGIPAAIPLLRIAELIGEISF